MNSAGFQIPKKIANPEQIGETWEEVEMVDVDLSPDQTTRVGEQINSKVKEKIIAAWRSEIKTIIFPAANRINFDELSDNVKEGFDVHFVDDYSKIF
ncbi:lon protease homolog 1, mitochondrial-like isoform X2 [Dendrobium catenatum]|uniref:lon protease homolog 1, mitochondrial-like isoform X2 n=1 Tax=Dendrobium catenatum TaxID=906689 RepID=UPI00109F996F|nr:lon protease homolog 1, mitochondrial-like isoform X2 [Dendrobium catenatum]